jgi:hypothetical protein
MQPFYKQPMGTVFTAAAAQEFAHLTAQQQILDRALEQHVQYLSRQMSVHKFLTEHAQMLGADISIRWVLCQRHQAQP